MEQALLFFQSSEWAESVVSQESRKILAYDAGIYPNDEQWVKIAELQQFSAVTVYARFTDSEPLDRQVFRFFLLLEILSRATEYLEVVMPYVPYSLQDRDVRGGDAAAFRVLLKGMESLGVMKLSVADLHSPRSLQHWDVPTQLWQTERLLADALQKQFVPDARVAVVAPDKGALEKALRLGEYLHAPVFTFQKERQGAGQVTVEAQGSLAHWGATDLVVIDDMINTGGTIAAIIAALREQTQARVWAAVSHGIFAGEALAKLQASGVERVLSLDSFSSQVVREAQHGEHFLQVVSCGALFTQP